MKYKELSSKPDYSTIQPSILEFWEKNRIFEQSVNGKTGEEAVFYDGPPFPTGKPHHGTVLVSFIKDMIARYQTMRGYKVPRVWGWDCHGLPIENQAEAQLGINDKTQIESELGIDKFNEKCFEIVSANNEAWREYITEMARWVDYDNAYKTMTPQFMESVMWAFKQCYEKGLIYKDYRVTPYCMHCETSLSISDTRESDSTRPRQDRWIIARFKADNQEIDGKKVYFLAWTTTPWTLPSNLCLAIGEKLDYAYVDVGEAIYVACKNVLSNFKKVFGEQPCIVKECKGADLLGMTYEPLFPYFASKKSDGAFRVVSADYVGADEGVGIVHTAPAFGEDDYWTCKRNNIPLVNPVDAKGHFTEEITDFYNVTNQNGDGDVISLNPIIIRFLYDNGKAVADGTIEHNYPHCWRCKRPLIYRAMDAYYFNIDAIKERLIEANEDINWVPDTVKHGRFGNWLENARDWNISRNRYWSTPIPIWKCEHCGKEVVLGSIDEIYAKSGIKLDNLHRQYMDKVAFPCECGHGTMKRIPEVLDCWFESASVPFAQKHYPFENKEWFDSHFPSDFIVEYTGQLRCWFYYLHVLAIALFDKPAFKNCVVHGTILAKDGKKLSKSSKNYTDPMMLMKTYGTDAFRLYLYQSNAMILNDLLFDESGIQDTYKSFLLPYWNACNFFISYANIDGFHPDTLAEPDVTSQLDKWILSKLYLTTKSITDNMDAYQVDKYLDQLEPLLDGLTNWYIRRSRRRFWGAEFTKDKKEAYETLYYVLVNVTKLLAPVAPIISEEIYRNLTGELSVHLADWPVIPEKYHDEKLLEEVEVAQRIIALSHGIRNKCTIKNRQPLSLMRVAFTNAAYADVAKDFEDIIKEELNVKKMEILERVDAVASMKYDPNFMVIRSKYPKEVPSLIGAIKSGKYELKDTTVEINGTQYDKDIILVTYLAKEGMAVASDGAIVVAIDTTITPELYAEGVARDVVRSIQDTRKQLGCEISDKISIQFRGEFPEEWKEYVLGETLSVEVPIAVPDEIVTVDTDNGIIVVYVKK